jgi:hypothetical protein
LQGLSVACQLTIPTFLEEIIKYLTPGFPRQLLLVNNGVGLSFIIVGLQIFSCIFSQVSIQLGVDLQIDFKTILTGAVYEKALRLSQESSRKFTQGNIVSLVNVDVEKVGGVYLQLPQFFISPVQVIVSIVLLTRLIGPSTWGGAGSLFGILVLQIGGVGFIGMFYLTFSNVSKTIFGIW